MDVADRLAHQGIYVPPSATIHSRKPKFRCNFPGCDTLFYEGEERARVAHMARHAKVDIDELREQAEELKRNEVFGEGDPEKQSWLARRYRQLVGKVPDPTNPKHY